MDSFVESTTSAILGMDTSTLQPIDCFSIHPLYSKEWVEFIQQIALESQRQKMPKEELARAFPNPGAAFVQLTFLTFDLKTAHAEKKSESN